MLWGTNVCLHFGLQVILWCTSDVRQGAVSSGSARSASLWQLSHSRAHIGLSAEAVGRPNPWRIAAISAFPS